MNDEIIIYRLDELDKKSDSICDHLEKIDQHFNNLQSNMVENNIKLEHYNQQLEVHIAGVRELKKNNELLREYIDTKNNELNERLRTIEKPLDLLYSIKRFGLWITAVGGAVATIYGLLKYLIK